MAGRNFTKKKPGITLSITPARRKLAIVAVVLTAGAVALESEVLDVVNPAGSTEKGGQPSDEFSELESILSEFGSDEDSPNTPQSESEVNTQLAAADESVPLLIPSVDEAKEIPARSVSFPRHSSSAKAGVQTGHSPSPSTFPGSGAHSFHSTRSDRPRVATGIRFTGDIQPIQ